MSGHRSLSWELNTDFHSTINQEYLCILGSDGSITQRKIATMYKVLTNKQHFIIYENRSLMYVLPHRAFKSPRDLELVKKYFSVIPEF